MNSGLGISKEDAYEQLYNAVVLNQIGFSGKWSGWRMAGDYLISPDNLRLRAIQVRALFYVHGYSARGYRGKPRVSDQMELFNESDPTERLSTRANKQSR
jgi:hypothetical protein